MPSCGQFVYSLRTTRWITCVFVAIGCGYIVSAIKNLRKNHIFSTGSLTSFTHGFQQVPLIAPPLLYSNFSTLSTPPITTKAKEKKGNNL